MRVAFDQAVPPVIQVENIQKIRYGSLKSALFQTVQAGYKLQVFHAGQFFEKPGAIGDIAGIPLASGGFFGQVMVVNDDAARIRFQEPGQHFDGCGFAGPVGSQETVDFSGTDLEADRVYGRVGAEAFGQVLCLQNDHGSVWALSGIMVIFSLPIIAPILICWSASPRPKRI